MVRSVHGVLVVFDDDQRVAQVAETFEGFQKLCVVPLMEADAGLVEDIQNAHQRRAYLGRQPDSLALPAGKGSGGAGERQIVEPHV